MTDTLTVTIPTGLLAALEGRDVFAAPEFAGRFAYTYTGTRATIAGTVADLAELGDYIEGLAGLVRDRILTASEMGYGHAKLTEFAGRFPTRPEVPADEPEAAPESPARDADWADMSTPAERAEAAPETPGDGTRYTFALIVYMAPGNGFGRTYYGTGVHEWKQWCRTARGAWDFVKYAARELGPETLAVYRDGVKIGEYGRRGDEIMEWFGDSVGWDTPRDRRTR